MARCSAPPPLVFLGPSLPRSEAEALCVGEYHPPIGRGDLARLAGDVARAIGVIDGVFHQRLAVTPNEVLGAIEAGHRVYGAASIGALRAVELAGAGMVGVGRVFEAFARGEADRDDEVAVTFDAHTGRPLSEPLIGMRLALQEAAAAGVLDASEADEVVRFASELHYCRRTWEAVLDGLLLSDDRRQRALGFLSTVATDLKADDARALLRRLAEPFAASAPLRGGDGYRLPPRPRLSCSARPIAALPAAPKVPGFTSVRTATVEATDRVLAPVIRSLGITRVADVTHLDTLGIPCYTAVAPGRGVSFYSGKSLDRAEARVGAQMEALEAALARDDRVAMRNARFAELEGEALDPRRLPLLGGPVPDLRTRRFDWVEGWDLRTGDRVWVPADSVFLREGEHPWHLSTNGLASGNCLAEAMLHALAEVVERDAHTLYTLRSARSGSGSGQPVQLDRYPFVDLATLPRPLRRAVTGIRAAGADVDLRWITSDVEVPTFLCLVYERDGDGHSLLHGGSGTHPDAAVAARRAITEAAQSRVTCIQGAREDLRVPATRRRDQRPSGGWFRADTPRRAFGDLASFPSSDVVTDLRAVLDALSRASLPDAFAVDLSHPEIPLAVVRVIVPGAEPTLDLAEAALGDRARRALRM